MKDGWEYKKLGEVGDIITGSTPSTKEEDNYNSSDVCFVKPSDIPKQGIGFLSETGFYISRKAYNNSRKLPKGSVLTTCIGIIGKVGILNVDATCNQQINAIIPHSNISSTFLAYSILSKRHYLEHISNAPVVPIINKKEFSNTTIPIPPLAEQERIVAELDLLSSIIDKKKAQLKELDQLAQSIFYTMFGDPITNEKGWEVKTIGDTCSITCGQDYKSVKDDNGQYPIYGTGGIMGWANQYRCPKHSVIIGRKGNINNPILVDVDFWNVDTAFGITPKNEELKVVYFFFFCKEYDFTKHDVSVTIPSLRRIDILKIKFPLPPLPLQQEFASKIEAIERQKSLIQQSIVETQTLFDSRMEHWFN